MAFNINAQVILSGPKNIKAVTKNLQKQLGTVKATVRLDIPKNLSKDIGGFNTGLKNLTKNINILKSASASANSQLTKLTKHFQSLSSSSGSLAKSQSSLQNALSKTGNQAHAAGSEIEAFGKDAALAVRRFAAFTVATGVIFGFVRAIQTATKAALDYEREITKVIQVTGAGAASINQLKGTIDDLSTSLGVDANELAELSRIFAQTGQSIDQVRSSIRAVARSSLAPSFGEMKNTAEGLIAAMAQFNIAADRSEEVLAGLNAVSKKFAVEAEDLVSVIRRAGGVFSVAAGDMSDPVKSLNELIGIFTAVRSTTRESADTIAVGLRTIFTRIQRRGTIDFLKQFNIELVDARGNFIGLFPAFQQLSKGLNSIIKSGDALTLSAITEELGGVRQVGKLIPAITQFNKALAATKVAGKAAAEGMGPDVAKGLEPLGKRLELVQQRFMALVRTISESKTFQGLANIALSMANAFLSVAEALKPLIPLMTTFAAIKISSGIVSFGSGFVGGIKKGGGAAGAGGALGGVVTGGGGGGGGKPDAASSTHTTAAQQTLTAAIKSNSALLGTNNTALKTLAARGNASAQSSAHITTAIKSSSVLLQTLTTAVKSNSSVLGTMVANSARTNSHLYALTTAVNSNSSALGTNSARTTTVQQALATAQQALATAVNSNSSLLGTNNISLNTLATQTGSNTNAINTAAGKITTSGTQIVGAVGNLINALNRVGAAAAAGLGGGGRRGGKRGGGRRGRRGKKFASGGYVSGPSHAQGGVPAILEGGEYVIPKTQYHAGGTGGRGVIGMSTKEIIEAARKQGKFTGTDKWRTPEAKGRERRGFAVATMNEKKPKLDKRLKFSVQDGRIGGFFLEEHGVTDPRTWKTKDTKFMLKGKLAQATGQKPPVPAELKAATLAGFFPSKKDIKKGSLHNVVKKFASTALTRAVKGIAKEARTQNIVDIPGVWDANEEAMANHAANRLGADGNAVNSVSGFLNEGVIQALTGAQLAGEGTNFDFPNASLRGKKKRLGDLFGGRSAMANLVKADAKASWGLKDGIKNKIINDINEGNLAGVLMEKISRRSQGATDRANRGASTSRRMAVRRQAMGFAAGGNVFSPQGTDTVPAMLTPGEFVINKKSAQKIGYGNLGKMNNYATGGKVQYLQDGGKTTGGTGGGGGRDAMGLVFGIQMAVGALAGFTTALASFDMSAPTTSLMALGMAAMQAVGAMTLLAPGLAKSLGATSGMTKAMAGLKGQFKNITQPFTSATKQFKNVFASTRAGSPAIKGGPAGLFGHVKPRAAIPGKTLEESLKAGAKAFYTNMGRSLPTLLKGVFKGIPGLITSFVAAPIVNAVSGAIVKSKFGEKTKIAGTNIEGIKGLTDSQGAMVGVLDSAGKAVGSGIAAAAITSLIPGLAPLAPAVGIAVASIQLLKGAAIGAAKQLEFNAFDEMREAVTDATSQLEKLNNLDLIGITALKNLNKELAKVTTNFNKLADASFKRERAEQAWTLSGTIGKGGTLSEAGLGDTGVQLAAMGAGALVGAGAMYALAAAGAKMGVTMGAVLGPLGSVTGLIAGAFAGALIGLGFVILGTNKRLEAIGASFDKAANSITPEFLKNLDTAFGKTLDRMMESVSLDSGDMGTIHKLASVTTQDESMDSVRQEVIDIRAFRDMAAIMEGVTGESKRFNQELNKIRKTQLFAGIIKGVEAEKKVLSDEAGNQLAEAFDLIRKDLDEALEKSLKAGNLNALEELLDARVKAGDISERERKVILDSAKAIIHSQNVRQAEAAAAYLAAAALSRVTETMDALAAGMEQFSGRMSGIAGNMDRLAGQITKEFDQITGTRKIGRLNVANPFDNLAAASDQDIDNAISQLSQFAPDEATGNVAFGDLGSVAKTQKELPMILADVARKARVKAKDAGKTTLTNVELGDLLKEELKNAGLELPPSIMNALMDTIRGEEGEGVSRQEGGKIFQIDKIDQMLTETGSIFELLGKEAAIVVGGLKESFSALGKFKNAVLAVAGAELKMLEHKRKGELELLDQEQNVQGRLDKIRGRTRDPSTTARGNLQARMGIMTENRAGQFRGAGMNVVDRLGNDLTKFSTDVKTAQRNIGMLPGQAVKAGTAEGADAAIKDMRDNSKKLVDSTHALNGTKDALRALAKDTTVLAAIEREVVAAQKGKAGSQGFIATVTDALNKFRKGEMSAKDFNKTITAPITAANKAVTQGAQLSFDEANNLFAAISSGDKMVTGHLRMLLKDMADKDPNVSVDDLMRQLTDNLNRAMGQEGVNVARGEGMGNLADAIQMHLDNVMDMESDIDRLGDEFKAFGDVQNAALKKLLDHEQNQLQAVLDTANKGFSEAALDFKEAVKEFAMMRGMVSEEQINSLKDEITVSETKERGTKAAKEAAEEALRLVEEDPDSTPEEKQAAQADLIKKEREHQLAQRELSSKRARLKRAELVRKTQQDSKKKREAAEEAEAEALEEAEKKPTEELSIDAAAERRRKGGDLLQERKEEDRERVGIGGPRSFSQRRIDFHQIAGTLTDAKPMEVTTETIPGRQHDGGFSTPTTIKDVIDPMEQTEGIYQELNTAFGQHSNKWTDDMIAEQDKLFQRLAEQAAGIGEGTMLDEDGNVSDVGFSAKKIFDQLKAERDTQKAKGGGLSHFGPAFANILQKATQNPKMDKLADAGLSNGSIFTHDSKMRTIGLMQLKVLHDISKQMGGSTKITELADQATSLASVVDNSLTQPDSSLPPQGQPDRTPYGAAIDAGIVTADNLSGAERVPKQRTMEHRPPPRRLSGPGFGNWGQISESGGVMESANVTEVTADTQPGVPMGKHEKAEREKQKTREEELQRLEGLVGLSEEQKDKGNPALTTPRSGVLDPSMRGYFEAYNDDGGYLNDDEITAHVEKERAKMEQRLADARAKDQAAFGPRGLQERKRAAGKPAARLGIAPQVARSTAAKTVPQQDLESLSVDASSSSDSTTNLRSMISTVNQARAHGIYGGGGGGRRGGGRRGGGRRGGQMTRQQYYQEKINKRAAFLRSKKGFTEDSLSDDPRISSLRERGGIPDPAIAAAAKEEAAKEEQRQHDANMIQPNNGEGRGNGQPRDGDNEQTQNTRPLNTSSAVGGNVGDQMIAAAPEFGTSMANTAGAILFSTDKWAAAGNAFGSSVGKKITDALSTDINIQANLGPITVNLTANNALLRDLEGRLKETLTQTIRDELGKNKNQDGSDRSIHNN